ncbi:MAG: serine dehydrogenasease, partial [Elusimicrobiota bacterium]|nr:serine dehydrogenasease [Elusimicrobiota bacterium]
MPINTFNESIKQTANSYLSEIEKYFKDDEGDVLFYCGDIDTIAENNFRTAIESLIQGHKTNNHKTLIIILHTHGGSAETTEKFVNIIRTYYKNVYFI